MRALIASSARTPRLRVLINGVNVNSVMHAEISNRGSFKSSRFELTISITRNTPDNSWLRLLHGKIAVIIFVFPDISSDIGMTFEGMADSISIDQTNGIARVIGRDYSAILVESTYQYSFCNQTASEIANSIAIRHGFRTNISATSTMVGSYQEGYNQILLNTHSRAINEWDLLIQLARGEGFELFTDGSTLVFTPASVLPRGNVPINVNTVIKISFHRDCPLSEKTVLTVKSWNSWLAQAIYHSNDQFTST